MATLPGYWQEDQRKRQKPISGSAVSPYSAPADSAGGPSPMGGGSAGTASAPKAAQGGGTGFVSFGQYFGGNAPAVQAQAQKVVQPGSIQPQARTGGAAPKEDPYASQIAQTSARFAALNPAAQSGDMGKNVGAFDQLLGGGETQRAAKGEQQRLGTLRAALEGEQATWQKAEERNKQAQEAATQRQAQAQAQQQNLSDATLRSAKARAFDDAHANGTYTAASPEQWWATLDPALKEKYLSEATYTDDSEYSSVSK
jgi:hypothetical protein